MKPVADKMDITVEEFVRRMYEKDSNGNWREFANAAVKLKWVDIVVEDIRDTSYIKQPIEEDKEEDSNSLISLQEQIDQQGQHYIKLPYLGTLDFYYLYNPTSYYR